jgi:hypothetical protein
MSFLPRGKWSRPSEQRATHKDGQAISARTDLAGCSSGGWNARDFAAMSSIPDSLCNVSVNTKANVYFDGGVLSHSVILPDGSKKTLGLIRPGSYHFNTDAAELMEIVAGECAVTLDGEVMENTYSTGASFKIAGKSGFTIAVKSGICEYICTFLS